MSIDDTQSEVMPFAPVDDKMLGNRMRMARKIAGYENAETFCALLRERQGVTVGGKGIEAPSLLRIERGEQDATIKLLVGVVAITGISFDWYLPSLRPDALVAWREAKGLQ